MKKRNMKNIYILLTGLCIALIIAAASVATNIKNTRAESHSNLVRETIQSETAEQETEESYTVRFYKGSVAVFDSHDKLYDILEIPSNILTDADREELNKGIHAKNKSELQGIIEDYSSWIDFLYAALFSYIFLSASSRAVLKSSFSSLT